MLSSTGRSRSRHTPLYSRVRNASCSFCDMPLSPFGEYDVAVSGVSNVSPGFSSHENMNGFMPSCTRALMYISHSTRATKLPL